MYNMKNTLMAISPIDGRYFNKIVELSCYFSEYALIKCRISVEIRYFIFLCSLKLKGLEDFEKANINKLISIVEEFDLDEAISVKEIEQITNHDVKAVEYYIKLKFKKLHLEKYSQYIHYGLTSQDINNTSLSLILKDATNYYIDCLRDVTERI